MLSFGSRGRLPAGFLAVSPAGHNGSLIKLAPSGPSAAADMTESEVAV